MGGKGRKGGGFRTVMMPSLLFQAEDLPGRWGTEWEVTGKNSAEDGRELRRLCKVGPSGGYFRYGE